MSERTARRRALPLCSVVAQERGLDPIGDAYPADHYLIIESPTPWPQNRWETPGTLSAELLELTQKVLWVEYPTHWVNVQICVVAPDKGYSQPGLRRVVYCRRPAAPFAEFERDEYLLPEAEIAPLAWAIFTAPQQLVQFAQYRQPASRMRDFLVCVDGIIDRACAVFGMKLYSTLRKLPEAQPGGEVRIWKASHFGGHVYAATVLTLPDGRLWAYLDAATGQTLVQRTGDIQSLYGCYRGWAGAPSPFLHVLERELMMQHGWPWFDFVQQGTVLAEDKDSPPDDYGERQPHWGEVELAYAAPNGGMSGRCAGRVEVSHRVETFYSSETDKTHAYPQYRIVNKLAGLTALT
jgi:hypothetical protein